MLEMPGALHPQWTAERGCEAWCQPAGQLGGCVFLGRSAWQMKRTAVHGEREAGLVEVINYYLV